MARRRGRRLGGCGGEHDPGALLLLAVVKRAVSDARRKSTPPGYRYDAVLFLSSPELRELLRLIDVELDDWRKLIGG